MMFKKVFGLAMVVALTACGGGKGKGPATTKEAFDEAAAERTDVAGSGYTHAVMKMSHYQKVSGQSYSMNYTSKYELRNGIWVVTESDLPSSGYNNFIQLTMIYAESLLNNVRSNLAPNAEGTYYVTDTTGTLEINGTADTANMQGQVSAEAEWEAHGLLARWHEKDSFSKYNTYSNVEIDETLTYTYSA